MSQPQVSMKVMLSITYINIQPLQLIQLRLYYTNVTIRDGSCMNNSFSHV